MRCLILLCFACARLILSAEEPSVDPAPVEPTLENMQLAAPKKACQLPDCVEESSGLVKSHKYKDHDVFWTLSDSGGKEVLYAVTSEGKLLREVGIPASKNKDWEDLSMDASGRLIIADIGDNGRKRDHIVLYRLSEPDALDPKSEAQKPEVFKYKYPEADGAHDAEALIINGECGYLFTKGMLETRCYKLPLPEKAPKDPVAVEFVASTDAVTAVTGAALSDDGKRLALVTYISIQVFDRPAKEEKPHPLFTVPRRSRLAWLGQTEAVAWDKNDLVLTTEGGAVYRVKDAGAPPKD
ncbi:MAG TPA: hypothetical protein VEJ63_00180 [Planctomycetota bacterium]|nr:hypothetical protein [Planctomycetota bacterium]